MPCFLSVYTPDLSSENVKVDACAAARSFDVRLRMAAFLAAFLRMVASVDSQSVGCARLVVVCFRVGDMGLSYNAAAVGCVCVGEQGGVGFIATKEAGCMRGGANGISGTNALLDADEEKAGEEKSLTNAGACGASSNSAHLRHTFSKRGDPSNMVLTNVLRRGHGPTQTPRTLRSHGTTQSLCAQL